VYNTNPTVKWLLWSPKYCTTFVSIPYQMDYYVDGRPAIHDLLAIYCYLRGERRVLV
jgi:hypothetical protein